jgi:hypothetical protein
MNCHLMVFYLLCTVVVELPQQNVTFLFSTRVVSGPGQHSWYSDSLWAGQSRDRILVGARFSAPIQNDPWPPPQPPV